MGIQIAAGKCADMFLLDNSRLELVGTSLDPKAVFGTVGVKQPAEYTIVNGKVTVRGGRLVNIDEDKIAAEADKKCMDYLGM